MRVFTLATDFGRKRELAAKSGPFIRIIMLPRRRRWPATLTRRAIEQVQRLLRGDRLPTSTARKEQRQQRRTP